MERGDCDNRYQLKNKANQITNNTRRQCEIKRICDSHNVLPSLIADCPHCQQILRKLNGQGDKSFIQDKLKPFIHNYAKIFCNEQFLAGLFEQNVPQVQHSNQEVKEQKYHSTTRQNNSKLKRSKINGNGKKGKIMNENVKDDPWSFPDSETSSSNGMFRNNYEGGDNGVIEHYDFGTQEREEDTHGNIYEFTGIYGDQSTDSLDAFSNKAYRNMVPIPDFKKSQKMTKVCSKSMEKSNKETICQKAEQCNNEENVNYYSKQTDGFVPEISELATNSSGTENETERLSNSLSDLNYDFDEGTTKENGKEVKNNCEEIKANERETKVENENFIILEKSEISTGGQEKQLKTDKQTEKLEMCKMDNMVNIPTPKSILNCTDNQTMNPGVVHDTVDCSGQNKESPPFFLNQNLKEPTGGQQITKNVRSMPHYQELFEFARCACKQHEDSFMYDKIYRRPLNYQPQKDPMFNPKNVNCPQSLNPKNVNCPQSLTYDFSTSYPGYSPEIKNINYFQSDYTCQRNPHRCLANPVQDIYPQSRDCYDKESCPTDYRRIIDSNRFKSSQRKAILDSINKNLPARWDYKNENKPSRERVTTCSVGQNNIYQNNVFGKKKTFDSTVTSNNYNIGTQNKQFFSTFKTSLSFSPDPSDIKRAIQADNERVVKPPLVRNHNRNEIYIRSARSEPSSFKFKCIKFKPVVKPYNLDSRRPDISQILKKYLGNDYKKNQSFLQSRMSDDRGPSLTKLQPLIGRRRKFFSIRNLRSLVNSKSRSYFSNHGRKKSKLNFDHSKKRSPKKIYVLQKCKHRINHYENIFQVDKNKKKLEEEFNAKCQRIRELIADQKNHSQIVSDINESSLNNLDIYSLRNKKFSRTKGLKTDTKENVKLLERAKSEKNKIELISFSKNRKVLENVEAKETKDAFTKIMSSKSRCRKQLLNHPQFYKVKDSCEKMKICTKEIDAVKKDWKKYEMNDDNKIELFKVEQVPKPLEPLVSKIIHPGNLCYSTTSSGEYYETSHIEIKGPY